MKGKTDDMQDFVEQCVDTFCIPGNIPKESLKNVKTPFLDESKDPKDWEIILERDCENEDDSPNRNKELDKLGEEIRNNRLMIEEGNEELRRAANRETRHDADAEEKRSPPKGGTFRAAAEHPPSKDGDGLSAQCNNNQ